VVFWREIIIGSIKGGGFIMEKLGAWAESVY
jgi:hypothetical protein